MLFRSYPLPGDTIDLLEHVIRTGQNVAATQADLTITRISVSTYATLPNKLQQARPIQVWIQRYNNQISPTGLTIDQVGGMGTTDTQVTLDSVVGLPASGFVKIDNEIIAYQNIVGNQIVNAWRGQANTTAASHSTGGSVYVYYLPCVNVWPTPNAPGNQYTLVYYRQIGRAHV